MQSKEYIRDRIVELSHNIMPDGSQVILFGSQARGDARPDSDWDILILLNKEKVHSSDLDNYCYPLTELGWEINEQIHPIIYSLNDWKSHEGISLLYHNVLEDGIRLC